MIMFIPQKDCITLGSCVPNVPNVPNEHGRGGRMYTAYADAGIFTNK